MKIPTDGEKRLKDALSKLKAAKQKKIVLKSSHTTRKLKSDTTPSDKK